MKKYFRLSAALPVLAWLCCAVQSAAAQTAVYPEIPGRFGLAGLAEEGEPRTVTPDTPVDGLELIICSDDAQQQRVDAVRRLADINKTSKDPDYIAYVRSLTRSADWLLTNEEDAGFRRYGVFMTFSRAYSLANASLPENSGDPLEWKLWKGVEKLHGRGVKDKDKRLREYFDRYVPLKKEPDWKKESARLRRVTEQIIKALPEYETDLRGRLALVDSTQNSQLQVLPKLLASPAMTRLPPELRAQFTRGTQQQFAYRLHTLWTNLYARNIVEAIGEKNARDFGVAPAEVKLGWPSYTQPKQTP